MRSVAVLGAGESGIGAALLAQKNGLEVFVSEYGIIPKKFRKELENHNIPFEEKGHTIEKIEKLDLIVKSPGIPDKADVIQLFRLRQKTIISEIEFASRFFDGKIISITGSNGKTTTTTLTYHLLKNAGLNVAVAGNIGHSFSRLLSESAGYDWVVLELSSFQLDDLIDFRSDISAILNITPDHLDRYDYNFEKYAQAKWNLYRHTSEHGLVILNKDNAPSMALLDAENNEKELLVLSASDPRILYLKEYNQNFEIALKGKHNAFNASVGIHISERLNLSYNDIQNGLNSYRGVEHRIETVDSINGLLFINDSKATNVDAVEVALDALDNPVIWIAGGVDKGNDYSQIFDLVKNKVSTIICLTKYPEKIIAAFGELNIPINTCEDALEAVKLSLRLGKKGTTVLLSPACASFDLFDNYEHRGRAFKEAVYKMKNEID